MNTVASLPAKLLLDDLDVIWNSVSDDKETNGAYQRIRSALASPAPSAGVGDALESALRYVQHTSGGKQALLEQKLQAALQHPAAPSVSPAVEGGLDDAAVEAGHLNFRSMQQCANAWLAVAGLLHELVPGWTNNSLTGREAARETIRYLAARRLATAEQPEGKEATASQALHSVLSYIAYRACDESGLPAGLFATVKAKLDGMLAPAAPGAAVGVENHFAGVSKMVATPQAKGKPLDFYEWKNTPLRNGKLPCMWWSVDRQRLEYDKYYDDFYRAAAALAGKDGAK